MFFTPWVREGAVEAGAARRGLRALHRESLEVRHDRLHFAELAEDVVAVEDLHHEATRLWTDPRRALLSEASTAVTEIPAMLWKMR